MSKKVQGYVRSNQTQGCFIDVIPFVFVAVLLWLMFIILFRMDILTTTIIAVIGSLVLNFGVRLLWRLRHPNHFANRIIQLRGGEEPPNDFYIQ